MATRITDGSGIGRQLHVTCDKCGREVATRLGPDNLPLEDPLELIGWRRGIARRDICPQCQSDPDLPTINFPRARDPQSPAQ